MKRIKLTRRLVTKDRFVRIMGVKCGLGLLFGVCYSTAIWAVMYSVVYAFIALYLLRVDGSETAELLVRATLAAWASIALFKIANQMSQRVDAIEPVALVTDRNLYLLPAREVLVRQSESPYTEKSAQLLRVPERTDISEAELVRAVEERE